MTSVKVEPALVREQIERLTHSDTFRNSAMQRRLLCYLAERSIADQADQLKEYTVGVEAFSKAETYDPRRDSTVRIQAGKLRRKIREYYEVEGLSDPISVDLPKGHFKLTFEPREPTGDLAASVAGGSQRKWLWVCAALGIACIVATCLAVYWGVSLKRLRDRTAQITGVWTPELEAIWQPFLTNRRPLIICIGTPLFVKFWPQSLPQMNLRSAAIPDWEAAQSSAVVETLRKTLRSPSISPSYNFTGIGEASGAFELAALLGTRRQDLALERSSTISWDEISRSDVIFLGPPKFNLQLAEMPVEQDLVMETNAIRNLRPKPGEPAVLPTGNWPSGTRTVEDYALISRIPGPGGHGNILVLAAVATAGTQAAAQYLTEGSYARDLVSAIRLPSGELPRFYQIVIKAKFKGGIPLQVSYVFHHVLNGR